MLTMIEGVYKNGCVVLKEAPIELEEGETVFVSYQKKIFPPAPVEPRFIWFGMLGPGEFTEEDFKAAEFHGDPDDGLDWS